MLAKRSQHYKMASGTGAPTQHRQQQQQHNIYGHSNAVSHQVQQEDFVFWSPPTNAGPTRSKIPSPHHNNYQRAGNSNILVEHHQQHGGTMSSRGTSGSSSSSALDQHHQNARRYAMNHAPRPKMGVTSRKVGVPVMTSTPSVVSSNPDPDNEPIYCEITKGDSPLKPTTQSTSNLGSSPSSKKSFPVQRRPIKQRTNLNRNRLAGDFSQLKLNRGASGEEEPSSTQSNVESKQSSSSSSSAANKNHHRLSCDFSNYAAIPTLTSNGPPSSSSNQQQHHRLHSQYPAPHLHQQQQQQSRPAGLGRRAVTQLEIITSRSAGLNHHPSGLDNGNHVGYFGSGLPSNLSTRDLTTAVAPGPYCSDSEYSHHKRPHAYLQRSKVQPVRMQSIRFY